MKTLSLVGKFAVSTAVLWFVTRFIDWSVVATRLAMANFWLMAAAVICIALQSVLATMRWQQVICALGAPDPGLWKMLASYFEGLFLGQVLPSTVGGDVLRSIRARSWGHTLSQAAMAVILERVYALAWLVVIAFANLPLLLVRVGARPEITIAVVVPVVWGGAVLSFFLLPALPTALKRFRSVQGLLRMSAAATDLLRRPRLMVTVAVTSLGGHMLVFVAVWLMAKSLYHDLGMTEVVLTMPLVMLVQMIPISLAGWGIREGAMAFVLQWFGVPTSDAVLLSVLLGLAGIVSSVPGAAAWLVVR